MRSFRRVEMILQALLPDRIKGCLGRTADEHTTDSRRRTRRWRRWSTSVSSAARQAGPGPPTTERQRYPYLWSSRSLFANTRNRRVLSIRPPAGLRLAAARAAPSLLV